MNVLMEESEFANTVDPEIFNNLSEFMYENENYNDVLYHFTLMELYNFFNRYINIAESITIDNDDSSDFEEY